MTLRELIKRTIKTVGTAGALTVLAHQHVVAAGWQDEYSPTSTSITSKSTCANWETRNLVHCVFIDRRTGDLSHRVYQIISSDGGVSWSAPTRVTTNADTGHAGGYDNDYDAYITYEKNSLADRLIISYATEQRGIQFRYAYAAGTGTNWSSPVTVVPPEPNPAPPPNRNIETHPYRWETSILSRRNGEIWIFHNVNGPEIQNVETQPGATNGFVGSGHIRYTRSLPGVSAPAGQTWQSEQSLRNLVYEQGTDGLKRCDAEYPRAWENNSGEVLLAFSTYVNSVYLNKDNVCTSQGRVVCTPCNDGYAGGYPKSNIHGIWFKNGAWQKPMTLVQFPNDSAMHPNFGYEAMKAWPINNYQLHLMFVDGSAGWVVRKVTSVNGGQTWSAPVQWSPGPFLNPFDVDPSFTLGSLGPIISYTDPWDQSGANPPLARKLYIRRYNY